MSLKEYIWIKSLTQNSVSDDMKGDGLKNYLYVCVCLVVSSKYFIP